MIFCYTNTSESFLATIREASSCSRYREIEIEIGIETPRQSIERVRDLGTLSLKRNASIISPLSPSLKVPSWTGRKNERIRVIGRHTENEPYNQHERHSYEFTGTRASCVGPASVCNKSFVIFFYDFNFSVFMGLFPVFSYKWGSGSCVLSWAFYLILFFFPCSTLVWILLFYLIKYDLVVSFLWMNKWITTKPLE